MICKKEGFIRFCTIFEEAGGFQFESNNLQETGSGLRYDATFREEHNYKIPVILRWEDNQISWDTPDWTLDDEEDGTDDHFDYFIKEVIHDFRMMF